MFVIFNILFVVHYYLFVMFNFFVRKNIYLFVLLKYLFPVVETNFLILKKYFFKKICKHRQVWSYFEDVVIRKIMMQSKFNLDAQFNSYNFFNLRLVVYFCMHRCSSI